MSAKQGRVLESDSHVQVTLPTTHPGCRGSTGEHHQSGLQRRGPYFLSLSSSWEAYPRPSSRRMVSQTPSIPFSVPCHVFLHPARWRWKNEGFGSVLALTCHSPKSKSLTRSWYPPPSPPLRVLYPDSSLTSDPSLLSLELSLYNPLRPAFRPS